MVTHGSGGVIAKIFDKYGTYEGHISVKGDNPNYRLAIFHPETNVFEWDTESGYHSLYDKPYLTYESLTFNFTKPFYLKAYRIGINVGFRFPMNWKILTKYGNSDYEEVHQSTELLCRSYSVNAGCNRFYETVLFVKTIKLCDSIKMVVNGKDSSNTYSLALNCIEFYEDECRYRDCTNKQHILISISKIMLFPIIFHI